MLKLRSLRLRLLFGAAATIFVALAASWCAMTFLFQAPLERALYLLLLWFVLTAVAWLQVELGLRPFNRVRKELEALKSNPTERLSTDHLTEIEPLTHAINELADAREKDLTTARRRAADLARVLRSPLAALSAGSRRAREAGAANAAEGLDRAIAMAAAAVNAELAHSSEEAVRHAVRHVQTAAQFVVERVIGTVEHTELGAQHVFEVEVPEDLFVPVAPEDLAELLRSIIENAARFAKQRVKVSGATNEDAPSLIIEDDGPGLGVYPAAQVPRRGSADEADSGLTVARELVKATRGQLTLGAASLGGLRVQIDWPAPRRS